MENKSTCFSEITLDAGWAAAMSALFPKEQEGKEKSCVWGDEPVVPQVLTAPIISDVLTAPIISDGLLVGADGSWYLATSTGPQVPHV